MKRKLSVKALLVIALLINLCACSKPGHYTSEKLEVEVRGDGTRTVTIIVTGPSAELYERSVSLTQEEGSVLTIKSTNESDTGFKLRLGGGEPGTQGLYIAYSEGEESYASASFNVTVDEKHRLTVDGVYLAGDDPNEALGEDFPEGSLISKGPSGTRRVSLTSNGNPWTVEEFDEGILEVNESDYSAETGVSDFYISAVAEGTGEVSLVNKYEKKRVTMTFEALAAGGEDSASGSVTITSGDETSTVETVPPGGAAETSFVLTLAGSASSVYNEMETQEYIEASGENMKTIRSFSSAVFVPSSVKLNNCSMDENFLDVSMETDDTDLEYLVFKGQSLKDELAAFAKAFPDAGTEAFDTCGVSVQLYQIEDYSVAIWEENDLLCELYILDIDDIIKAGDVVETFLSDTGL